MHMCSSDQFLAQQTEFHPRSEPPDTYFAFISIPCVQGVSKAINPFVPKVEMLKIFLQKLEDCLVNIYKIFSD